MSLGRTSQRSSARTHATRPGGPRGGQDRRPARHSRAGVESTETTDAIIEAVQRRRQPAKTAVLTLSDESGRQVVVPADKLAYVEIGEPETRRVGFGALSRAGRVSAQADSPSARHPAGVVLGEPGEHPAHLGQVRAAVRRRRRPAASASASRSAATRCAWLSASPTSRRPHSASRPAEPRVRLDRGPHPVDRERRVPGVLEDRRAPGRGSVVEVRRDLAVEVLGDAVADVRLDQALQPVGRRGALVERLEGGA